MTCIIIDDEPLALDLLETYIEKVPFLELKGAFTDPFAASDFLKNTPVDLVFLDIQMPDITGIQWLKTIEQPPIVIFTTAYSKYAIEGFNLDALDYLLKPFDFKRFLKAATKAHDYYRLLQSVENQDNKIEIDHFFVKADYQTVKVNFDDVLYIESMDDYCRIFLTTGKSILTLVSMKKMAEQLPPLLFCRVHRSYIVAFSKIEKTTRKSITIGKKEMPIGDSFSEAFNGQRIANPLYVPPQ